MTITVLTENTSIGGLPCEHGLSLYIETEKHTILLDSGSTGIFADNASALKKDLSLVDIAVLSHGHYDHSGGFCAFFRENKTAPVYAQRQSFEKYFSAKGGMHEIGIPDAVKKEIDRFVFVDRIYKICDGVILVGHNTKGLEKTGERAGLYRQNGTEIIPDDFSHEQTLVIESKSGLVIFNSCSHAGVKNIINEVKKACPGEHILAYVGGLHMKGSREGKEVCTFSDSELDELSGVIKEEGIEAVYTGHCTGEEGYRKLKERLNGTLCRLSTGIEVVISG